MNKDGEFMSLTLSTFKLFLTLAKTDSDVNRIKVTQNGSDIEILTLYGNIMLTMVSCKYHSTICISKQIMDILIQNNDSIELRINEEKKKFIHEPSAKNRIIVNGEESLNSKAKTFAKYSQSIDNVVKSASDSLVKQKDNTECIGWCTYGEPEKTCRGETCSSRNVVESNENVVKSASDTMVKQTNNDNNKSIVDFIDHFMCNETGNSCGGGNCTTRNVVETVSGDIYLTPPLMKPSNLMEINVKHGNDKLVKQNKKRKRKIISETDDKHPVPPLKKSSNLKENDEKQGNVKKLKQDKKRKRKDIGKKM